MRNNVGKIIGWGVAVLALVAIIGVNIYQHRELKADKPVVKIGVTLPLTGAMARLGQQAKNAMLLRLSEIKENSKFNYTILFEDDQLQSSKEFTNAQKLINFDNIDVMISGFAGGASAIASLADKKQVIYWNFQWTDEIAKSSPYCFTYNQMPADVAEAWLNTAYQKGYRRIAVVNNETHAGGEYLIKELEKKLPDYSGMEIVSLERIPLFGSDLRTILLKMNSKKPDIYLSLLLNPSVDEFAKKMKEQGINVPISSINRFEHSQDKPLFEGNWGVGADDYTSDFFVRYKQKYQEEVTTEMAPYAYDVVDIIVQAYEKNDTKAKGKKAVDALLDMKGYKGGFGVTGLDGDGIFHVPVIVGEIKDGKFVKTEE